MAVSGLTWTWSAYFVDISFNRSAGGGSNIQSAWPFSTWVTCASAERPNFCTITSGLPAGCASFDHSLKLGLRTSLSSLFGLYSTHLYGPVPGGGILTSVFGVPVGRMNAKGTESWSRNSGSLFVRWNVTLPDASSMTTPWSRLQLFGVLTHASPPTITLYQVPAFGLWPILNRRSNVYLTSLAFSVLPFENLIPLRSVKV